MRATVPNWSLGAECLGHPWFRGYAARAGGGAPGALLRAETEMRLRSGLIHLSHQHLSLWPSRQIKKVSIVIDVTLSVSEVSSLFLKVEWKLQRRKGKSFQFSSTVQNGFKVKHSQYALGLLDNIGPSQSIGAADGEAICLFKMLQFILAKTFKTLMERITLILLCTFIIL